MLEVCEQFHMANAIAGPIIEDICIALHKICNESLYNDCEKPNKFNGQTKFFEVHL